MKFHKNYGPQRKMPTINNEPSMVKPEFAEEGEINNIMARYTATGYLPPQTAAPQFLDLSVGFDFDMAQEKILTARKLFLEMPLEVRDEFGSAERLLMAYNDPKKAPVLRDMGLLPPLPSAPKNEPAQSSAVVAGSGVQPQKAADKPPAS